MENNNDEKAEIKKYHSLHSLNQREENNSFKEKIDIEEGRSSLPNISNCRKKDHKYHTTSFHDQRLSGFQKKSSSDLKISKSLLSSKIKKAQFHKSNTLFDTTEEAFCNNEVINQKMEEKLNIMKEQMLNSLDEYTQIFENKYNFHIEEIKKNVIYKTKRINELLRKKREGTENTCNNLNNITNFNIDNNLGNNAGKNTYHFL